MSILSRRRSVVFFTRTTALAVWLTIAVLSSVVHAAGSNQATVRHYYIAAEDVKWDYAPTEQNLVMPAKNLGVWGEQRIYKKTRYIEYTDATFTQKKPQPEHLGILGPVIRGTVGDTIKIHFRNKASQPYSIHPIGTTYGKTSEGAAYAGQKPPGSAVPPGQNHVYTLKVRPEDGPGPNDPSSILRLYRSHVDPVGDVSRGLVGPMIIMRADQRGQDALPKDVDREFVVMFMVFDENEEDEEDEGDLMHTMNGYIFGNLSGLTMDQGDRVRWYLFAMGSEVDLHTPHWHGNGVIEYGHRREVLMLLPAFSTVADMKADNPGTWLFKCNVGDHIEAGMKTLYTVRPYVNASDQTIRVP